MTKKYMTEAEAREKGKSLAERFKKAAAEAAAEGDEDVGDVLADLGELTTAVVEKRMPGKLKSTRVGVMSVKMEEGEADTAHDPSTCLKCQKMAAELLSPGGIPAMGKA